MDAFFTIAPVTPESPEDDTIETVLVESDRVGTVGNHGSCIIA